jgi:hypothetical protein
MGPEAPATSPAQTRRIVPSMSSKSAPLPAWMRSLAAKSSGQPPMARPAVSRPPDTRSREASCFPTTTAFRRAGTVRIVVISSICRVLAAAAASATTGSRLS